MIIPIISIVIPCYNSGFFLNECVQSILSQKGNFHVKEIIIVDDCSTDDKTRRSLDELQKINLIRITSNKGQKGAAGARNTGISAVQSEWIIFLDADDVLTENSIQKRVQALEHYPDCGWVGGDFILWNEDGSFEEKPFFQSRIKPSQELVRAYAERCAVLYCRPVEKFISVCLTQVGVSLIKTDLVKAIGGFREYLRQAEDYQFWIRLALISDFVFIPEPLMYYRQHGANTTAEDIPPRYWTIKAYEELRSDKHFIDYIHMIDSRLAEFNIENSIYFRRKNRRSDALLSLFRAFQIQPNIHAMRSLIAALFIG